ncbi:MAG: class I SAM-dependent methyltransferase [Verrucomicrobiae bacterium]|nr:class I SAM-dependent methyltransferase [Verrucomicrobiae bacterium]
MARNPAQFASGGLARAERLLRGLRRHLSRPARPGQTERPNDADEWASLYAAERRPVRTLESPIARALTRCSFPGELLLETGCGAAAISAELATTGRRVALADFSEAILIRARALFEASGLPAPETTVCDLTRPLPWADQSVDVTWSSGVLEHWPDAELVPIVREQARISRRRVIALVPHAGCLAYRWGKSVAEAEGTWPFGRELPRASLRAVFEQAGLRDVTEETLWAEAGMDFLNFVDPEIRREAAAWLAGLPADDPIRQQQGYLLMTVGSVPAP